MKHKHVKILSLIVAVVLLVTSLSACNKKQIKLAMEYKDSSGKTVSSADQNFLSLAMAVVNFQLGASALGDEMWDMQYQEGNDTTVRDIVVAQTVAYVKGLLQAEYLCDNLYGIGISDEQKDSVDSLVSQLSDAYGSEKEFSNYLSVYGATIGTLERYMTLVVKQDTLYKSFYSEGGLRYDEIDGKKRQYFADNFHIADHILIKYSGGIKDDGTEIPLNDEQKQQKREQAKTLYNEIVNGVRGFDEALGEYNEDTYKLGYPFGYFVPEDFYWTGISTEVQDRVTEMQTGEIAFVDTSDGAYIIRKNEMEPTLYTSNGNFEAYIESTLAQEDFMALCESADGIVLHEDVISELDPALIPPFNIDALGQ